MTELEYNIGEVAGFMRDLQEEKFPVCAQWDERKEDCNCYHCRIEHYGDLADEALREVRVKAARLKGDAA